jgi:hypothetical protein
MRYHDNCKRQYMCLKEKSRRRQTDGEQSTATVRALWTKYLAGLFKAKSDDIRQVTAIN